jgi:hypothetical protein
MFTKENVVVRREIKDGRLMCVAVPIIGETLELGLATESDFVSVTSVNDCRIHLHSKRADVSDSVLTNCEIVACKVIRDMNWAGVKYVDCKFRGVYRLLSIGGGHSQYPGHPHGLFNCNFSQARLDAVSLCNADWSSFVWPAEPHMFIKPIKEAEQRMLECIPKENTLREFRSCVGFLAFHLTDVSAMVASRYYFEKFRKLPMDMLLPFYENCRKLDFVQMNF